MDKLKFINEQMTVLSVPYEFGEWTSKVQYPYFVGEFTEEPSTTEDGYEQTTLILNGFHRGKYIDLEAIRAKIKKHFHPIYGLRATTNSGAIAVFYGNAFPVPTNEA
ncbi:MAG: hypothetical protein IKY14_05710, partial [Erysipelotrichaceae bacterium]|nr:hypothetical protein [Erysipelotrichaceae bacterium]